jgi:hypothetical protein
VTIRQVHDHNYQYKIAVYNPELQLPNLNVIVVSVYKCVDINTSNSTLRNCFKLQGSCLQSTMTMRQHSTEYKLVSKIHLQRPKEKKLFTTRAWTGAQVQYLLYQYRLRYNFISMQLNLYILIWLSEFALLDGISIGIAQCSG